MADTTVGLHLDALFSAPPEDVLIAGLCHGDDQAYEILIQRYQQPVYNLVCRLLNDPSDASDIVQEVFLKIFRNIRSFRHGSSLKTWIYRIAVNEAYNHRRWFSRHLRQEVALSNDDTTTAHADTFADPGRSPFEEAADHETRALVEVALEKLKPNFRTAVVLRDIEDLSYEEIASVLDVSLGTVKSRILRGREALRKILEAQGARSAPQNGAGNDVIRAPFGASSLEAQRVRRAPPDLPETDSRRAPFCAISLEGRLEPETSVQWSPQPQE